MFRPVKFSKINADVGNGTKATGTDIQCCTSDYQLIDPSLTHPACMAIEVDVNDKFYTNKKCMNFVRSIAGPRIDCSVGYADQVILTLLVSSLNKIYDGEFLFSFRTFSSTPTPTGWMDRQSTEVQQPRRHLCDNFQEAY